MTRIRFFCEDKGQHRRIWLDDLFSRERGHRSKKKRKNQDRGVSGLKTDHGRAVLQLHRKFHGERTKDGWLDPTKQVGLELLCPRCGRNPQLSPEKIGLLESAGLAVVDISLLPF